MLRFSSYSILSFPLSDGSYALLNGISGALDWIPQWLGARLENVLASRDAQAESELVQALDAATLDSFRERGHLTTLSPDQEREQVCAIAAALHDAAAKRPSFLIVPNLDCNYRCTYCFERPLQNSLYQIHLAAASPSSPRKVVMTRDQVDAAYRAIVQLQRQATGSTGGQLILYGGEPLDREIKAVVSYIVSRGLQHGYSFAAVTNGHDLDAYLGLLGPGLIEQLQITFDGPKPIHDRRRIHRGHESSFEKIVANIDRVLSETEAEVQLRVHLAPETLANFCEVLEFFRSRGWTDHPRVVIYGSTLYAKNSEGKVRSTVPNDHLARELSAFTRRYQNVYSCPSEFHATVALRPVFTDGTRFELRGVYCSANTASYIFAPDGAVYSCWESVGQDCSRIGTYDGPEGLVIDLEQATRWFHRSIATLEECQRCAYALACGGGCAQYAEYNTGSLYKPFCDHFQQVFRHTLAENLELFLQTGRSKLGSPKAVVRE